MRQIQSESVLIEKRIARSKQDQRDFDHNTDNEAERKSL